MLNSVFITQIDDFDKINLIDIRSPEKYNIGHIKGAKNIPFNDLLINYTKYLNRNYIYYIYCQKGIQSRRICEILSNKGYLVINIIGGYEAFIKHNN